MSWTNDDAVEVREVDGVIRVLARTDLPEGCIVGVFDGVAEVFDVDAEGRVDWREYDDEMVIHLKLADGKLYALVDPPGTVQEGINHINHSCTPTCRAEDGTLIIETVRAIAKGEELNVNYHRMDLVKRGRTCWCDGVPEAERCII